jgi:hypothetical protein
MKKFLLPLLLLALPAAAQVPSGTFTYTFTNRPLWDFSGTYYHAGVEYTGISTTTLSIGPRGGVTGSFEEFDTNHANGDFFNGAGVMTGRTYSTPYLTGMLLYWHGLYHATHNGRPYRQTVSAQANDLLDPTIPALQLHWAADWCVIGGGCTERKGVWGSTTPDLEPGMTGDWALSITLEPVADQLTGSAVLTLSNGRAFTYSARGHFYPLRNLAVLTLTGTGDGTGTSVTLTALGSQMNLNTLTANVLGQKVKFKATP